MIRKHAVGIYSSLCAFFLLTALVIALMAVSHSHRASVAVPVLITFGFLFAILATMAAQVRQSTLPMRD